MALSKSASASPSPVEILPAEVAKAEKVELLRRADAAARASGGASSGGRVRQLSANYRDSRRQVLVANSEGVIASDDQVRIRFGVSAVANGDTGMQTGSEAVGATMGFELFDHNEVEELARAAAQRALSKLRARPAPSGTMPVVIKSGTGGVLFHEACGHGLEADHIAKSVSVFTGRVGETVASPLVTLVDDGTMSHEWGAMAIDDEGHPTGRNVLIEDGVLTDYMWDWLRAHKEGRASSGNGRRQSYQHLPMVRMTNTFLMNGAESPEEIIRPDPPGRLCGSARRRTGQHDDGRFRVRHDGGLPHRGRAAHGADPGRQPDRQRPASTAGHRCDRRTTSRWVCRGRAASKARVSPSAWASRL